MTKNPFKVETDLLPPEGKHVVVIVDDDIEMLAALNRALHGEPYQLRVSTSPQQVLAWVQQGNVSMVISDQCMPDMNGTALLGAVRAVSPQTVRVILTGFPSSELAVEGADSGLRWLATKPFDNENLKQTIVQLLRESELNARS
jgi:DNA-binding NtrC family response regulator